MARLSKRTAWQRQTVADYPLSDSNPTRYFPVQGLYQPEPFGLRSARQAVCDYYARRGRHVLPERVLLTASTSESYAHAFTLFCDPGDTVLVPTPSYPLFDSLADITSVRLERYPYHYADGWHLDRAALETAPEARALIVVTPNNPTGHYLLAADWAWLQGFARERDLALIVDEVFADYALQMPPDAVRFVTQCEVTCLTLSGLSKVAALPQLKLGWMVLSGPHDEAQGRLEILLDTFLSVATPVQLALPALLHEAEALQHTIRQRLLTNLSQLPALRCEGGWTAIVRGHVAGAQPGALYDIAFESSVISLLLEPSTLAALAVDRAASADARR